MAIPHITPPRKDRFFDPAASVVWAAIEQLDEPTNHQLLAELQQHLAVRTHRTFAARVSRARDCGAAGLENGPVPSEHFRH